MNSGMVRKRALLPLCLAATGLATGCADLGLGWPAFLQRDSSPPQSVAIDSAIYRRAETERNDFFEREVERLRADLRQAEESIVALESGLRGVHSRADAVSAVAEARIALERVSKSVPWRSDRIREARAKLDEAKRQLEAGHVGSAVFFASRAQRVTDSLRAEASQVAMWRVRRVVRTEKVNLRSGPSQRHAVVEVLLRDTPVYPERSFERWTLVRTPDGRIGWVHSTLLERL